MSGRVEYRLRWRRDTWRSTTASKTRAFARLTDLETYRDHLQDYAPLEYEIDVRDVGPWRAAQ